MLQAALCRGPSALAAWGGWVKDVDVERLDADSQWLMPLLYANMRAHGVSHPVLTRCRNVYLHNWYKGNAVLHALAAWLRAIARTGERTPVLLGGTAVALRSYPSVGARPVESVDLWNAKASPGSPSRSRPPDVFPGSLRVHDRVLDEAVDAEIWRRAQPVAVMGAPGMVMSPADQLVHLCLHRDAWDSRSRLLWIADAVRLIASAPALDWALAWEMTARLGRAGEFRSALGYLRRSDVPAPTSA